MSKIKQLIKELCPGGVTYGKLGNFASIKTGSSNRQDAVEGGLYPFYVRSQDVLKINTFEFNDESILIPGEGGIGDIFHYVNGKYGLHQRVYRIHIQIKDLNTKFIFYYLKGHFKSFILQKALNAAVSSIRKPMIQDFEIPLPPLPIQQEIVRILDTFTEAQANLEQELELRKKQYEYYRNQLLTFDENDPSVKWMKLGGCGKMIKGNGILKSDFVDSGVPCIHYGQLHTYYGLSATSTISYISEGLAKKSRFAHKGDLVIATTSEDVEACCKACAWLGEEAVAVSGDAHIFVHDQNPKYMAYLFRTNDFAKQKQVAATGAKVTRVSGDNMLKFKFLFPSKARQQEIVTILDKFESAIQTLEEELALRKKQYEYYREKLLTFN